MDILVGGEIKVWWTWGFDIGGWKIEIRLDRKNVISRFFFFFFSRRCKSAGFTVLFCWL